ncbi:ricin-type beta-trefoil lectin domain protein [Streptomyces erythrochromogenes]|uniref:ricin-type beta-trefoil lectin domain protein n=1 Tax=Streptomyces erythrochromogenes TaxID=285574 RepID=UPI00340CBC77
MTVYDHSTVPSATGTTLVSAVNGSKCANDNGGSSAEGNPISIHDCSTPSGTAQTFQVGENGELRVAGTCVTTKAGGTAVRTLIQLNTCNGANGQQWLPTPDSGFYNPQTGLCLDLPAARTDNGTQLELSGCYGLNAERWLTTGLATPLGATG